MSFVSTTCYSKVVQCFIRRDVHAIYEREGQRERERDRERDRDEGRGRARLGDESTLGTIEGLNPRAADCVTNASHTSLKVVWRLLT
jgi:hypothetical protein